MRIWSWIAVFFLLQYAYCGQENPDYEIKPTTLTVSALFYMRG